MKTRLVIAAIVALGLVGTSVAQTQSISDTFNGASSSASSGGGSKSSTGGTVPYFHRPTR